MELAINSIVWCQVPAYELQDVKRLYESCGSIIVKKYVHRVSCWIFLSLRKESIFV